MMVYNSGNWKTLSLLLANWLLGAIVIVVFSLGALSLLTTFIGKDNFPALTVFVSVVGALVAISSFRTTADEKKQARARAMAFASQMANETLKALSRPLPKDLVGAIENPFMLDVAVLTRRKPHIDEMTKAVAALDAKEMPSVESMAALIELKAAMKLISIRLDEPLDKPIDFDKEVARLGIVIQRLGLERDKIYPTYEFGGYMILSNVERR